MPAGISHPWVGYASFCAIKFAGYSLAAHYISRSYGRTNLSPLRVGGTRTLIGMAAGAAYFGVWLAAQNFLAGWPSRTSNPNLSVAYLAGLLPIRIAEWWLLIWIFYDREFKDRALGWRTVGLGTIWSYVLDAPAIAGFIATAGVWIC